jgi:hypothetical protein
MIYKCNTTKSIFLFTAIMILTLSTTIFSQAKDTTSGPLTFSGLFDFNYNKNFNSPASNINGYRNFDVKENQFNINLVKVTLQKSANPVGFRLDLAYGQAMDLVNSTTNLGSQPSLRNVEQAYLTATIPWGNGLTIDAGKMVTHMGGEVIETPANINYSRSLLFTLAIPYYHLGVMASYPFSTAFSATIYIYNGWNDIDAINNDKTLGAEISWTISPAVTFIQNWIGGAEEPHAYNKRHVFDSILNIQATDALYITLNGDYGQEADSPAGGMAVWKGIAGTVKYSISDASAIAARGEYYYDQNGFTSGTVQKLKEVTLTYEYKFTPSLLTRLEFRDDMSDMSTFEDSSGGLTKTSQSTLLVGAVYSF